MANSALTGFGAASLALPVTVPNGGTGLATLTANNVILGNGASAPTFVAPSTIGNVLTSNGTTWTSAAAAGGGATFSGSRAYNSSDITLTTNTETYITLNSERFDTDSYHSTSSNTSRMTAPSTGYYLMTFNGWISNPYLTTPVWCYIRVNRTTDIAYGGHNLVNSGTVGTAFGVSTIYYLTSGDYVESVVYHERGSNLTLASAASYSPEFSIVKLG